jgi:signal peptidase I
MRKSRLPIIVALLWLSGCGRYGIAFRPSTDAMLPALGRQDMCKANPFAYSNAPVERFDIVVYQAPEDVKRRNQTSGDVLYIKRVIGLPGEKIQIRNNDVFINDRRVDEPYQTIKDDNDTRKDFGPVVVPENEYFLLGDNRPSSEDSRYYAHPTIGKADIYSKVTEIYKDHYK